MMRSTSVAFCSNYPTSDSRFRVFTLSMNRLKRKRDIVGAFKCDPTYLKHKNEDSGTVVFCFVFLTPFSVETAAATMVKKHTHTVVDRTEPRKRKVTSESKMMMHHI